jgi:7-keto-8-aminopelargonate synthetase-like enzyme
VADKFLEALATRSSKAHGLTCQTAILLAAMPPAHSEAVSQEIDDLRAARDNGDKHRHTATSLAEILNEFGYKIAPKSVQRHVGRRCKCD